MTLLYPGWGTRPAIQTTNSSGDLFANPQAPAGLAPFAFFSDQNLGHALAITMQSSWAGEASNGKVMVGPRWPVGSEFYVKWTVELPSVGAPTGFLGDWFQHAEIYGLPFNGPPTINFLVNSDKGIPRWAFDMQASFPYPARRPWLGPPVVFNEPHEFVVRVVLGTSSLTGLVEIWFDGARQTFIDDTQTLRYATVAAPNQTGPQVLILDQYGPPPVYANTPQYTIYFGSPIFGSTLADVLAQPDWRLHAPGVADQNFSSVEQALQAAGDVDRLLAFPSSGPPVFVTRES